MLRRLEDLIKAEETHSPESGDDFARHVELYLGYINQLESKVRVVIATCRNCNVSLQ